MSQDTEEGIALVFSAFYGDTWPVYTVWCMFGHMEDDSLDYVSVTLCTVCVPCGMYYRCQRI